MTRIEDLMMAYEKAKERLYQAEMNLDHIIDPELIDAAIYEYKACQIRHDFYRKKIKEAVKSGQAIPCNGYIQFGGRR
ncbi:DUF2508 family protein [Thermoanaerobacterium sp. DL9XJH110]|uniref:DUF2508 family protein n=1 Tax=Thermoanaerobacterium sp. DL9XJH110 TaxID=3386643 RepID=UPI003BB4DDD7